MSEYTPTTEEVRQTFAYVQAGLDHDDGYPFVMDIHVTEFDRWLAEVKAEERRLEREHLIDGLRMVADYVLMPSKFRDGYAQALSDIEEDSLPNSPRFTHREATA